MTTSKFTLPPNFVADDVKNFLDANKGLERRLGITDPSGLQLILLISVANALFAKFKVPLRLTSVIT